MKTSLLPCLLPCLLLPLSAALVAAQKTGTPATPTPVVPQVPKGTAMVKHVTAPEAARNLAEAAAAAAQAPEKAIAVIDVRTPAEFAEGHIKGARNVDIASPDFRKNLAKLDPGKTYLVHCAAGGRSTRSLSVLSQLGFKSIIHLDGGLNSWKEAGLPLEKSPVK